MRTRLSFALAILCTSLLHTGCAGTTRQATSTSFDRTINEVIDDYLAWRPVYAVSLGLHEYDGRVSDLSMASIRQEHAKLLESRQKLVAAEKLAQSEEDRQTLAIVRCGIENELLGFEVFHSFTRNPMTYASAIDVNMYVKRAYAPIETRARHVVSTLRATGSIIQNARDNLEPALPRTFIENAISMAEGNASFIEQDLPEALSTLKNATVLAELKEASTTAAAQWREYAQWLRAIHLPSATDDFAIGKEGYSRMLQAEMIAQPTQEILEIGMRYLQEEQARFETAAKKIDPAKPAVEVYRAIQNDHPTAASLVNDTRKNLESIREFVSRKGLISMPETRVRVEETPRYARATTFASMDSPGSFERTASDAYYYVTPVDPNWDEKQQKEWLTAFNFYTTDIVSIHEAYPGHYVHFDRVRSARLPRAAKVFGSYSMIEGWAHYCEQMVMEAGFPNGTDPVKRAKYELAQSAESLLRIARLVASIKLHTEGWSVEQATRFFMESCHYEEQTARAEAERGTYDPGYCFYTIGKLQVLKLREDMRKQDGAQFNLKRFHDRVIGHGAPPVGLLRRRMLKDATNWDQTL